MTTRPRTADPGVVGYGRTLCCSCGEPTRDHPVGFCAYYQNGVTTRKGRAVAARREGKNIR